MRELSSTGCVGSAFKMLAVSSSYWNRFSGGKSRNSTNKNLRIVLRRFTSTFREFTSGFHS